MKKQMTKRILSGLLCLVMAVGMFPATAFAEDVSDTDEQTTDDSNTLQAVNLTTTETHTNHCVCGATHKEIGDHKTSESIEWTAWTDELAKSQHGADNVSAETHLPGKGGYYYLTEDVTLSNAWTPEHGETTVLCLNGHSIQSEAATVISLEGKKTVLTLTDCKGGGKITHAENEDGTVCSGGGVDIIQGTFNMYGGEIIGNKWSSVAGSDTANCGGGGVCMPASEDGRCKFNMYGGRISGNEFVSSNESEDACGGGVYVGFGNTFNMYGGEISGNKVTNTGGNAYGGGVYVDDAFLDYKDAVYDYTDSTLSTYWATFNMSGGTITGNTVNSEAAGNAYGGGVYADNCAIFKVSGDVKITGNKAGATTTDSSTGYYTGGTENNVQLYPGGKRTNVYPADASDKQPVSEKTYGAGFIQIDDGLTDDARIGISADTSVSVKFASDAAKNNNLNYSAIFTSDKEGYETEWDDTNNIIKIKEVTGNKVTLADGGSAEDSSSGLVITNPADSGNDEITVIERDGKYTVTVPSSGGKVKIGKDNGTEYEAAEDNTKLEVTANSNKLTAGAVKLDKGEQITVGTANVPVVNTGDVAITVTATDSETGKVTIPEGGKAQINDTELTVTEDKASVDIGTDGTLTVTSSSGKVTIGDITYAGKASEGLGLTINFEGTITVVRGYLTIDQSKLVEDFSYEFLSGQSVTIGSYVYTAPAGGSTGDVTIKGRGTDNTPAVVLKNEGGTVDVALASDESTKTTYTAANANTCFAMTDGNADAKAIKLLSRGGDETTSKIKVSEGVTVTDGKNAVTAKKEDTQIELVGVQGNLTLVAGKVNVTGEATVNVEFQDGDSSKTVAVTVPSGKTYTIDADETSPEVSGLKNGDSVTADGITYMVTGDSSAGMFPIDSANAQLKDNGDKAVVPVGMSANIALGDGTAPAAQTVTVTNTGNQTITLTQPTAGNYEIGTLSETKLAAGETATFTVQPKTGLAARTYNETITVQGAGSGNETNSIEIAVKFTVSAPSGGGSSSSTTTTTDNVVNTNEDKRPDIGSGTDTTKVATTTATVKNTTTTATNGTKTTTATIDSTTAAKLVEKAVENKSEEIVVNTATAATVAETAAGTTTKVDLPEQTVKAIAEKTDAAVTIKSDAAEVRLDTGAVKAVAEQAGDTGTVNLVVVTVAQNEKKMVVDLKLVTSKGTVTDFRGGNVSVTVQLNTALASKPVVCVYIDDFGIYHKVKGEKEANGKYTFETGHFSTYAVMAEEEADQVIAGQTENIETLAGALSLQARSAKTKKGSIKVTLSVDGDAIKAIEDLGYTVKYKYYRSTKKAAGYKVVRVKAGKTYINKMGRKGTRYYYKARVMIYNTQGELVAKTALSQCKYASCVK